MANIVLEGKTLGEIHRNYNKLVNEACVEKPIKVIEDINYDDPDLDNLFKIDYACRNKDVEYILKILKCKDMLYCSKVIKGSTWLITAPKYSHIINADYLFTKLFPEMITSARNKFLLHIRLHLRDEERAEGFFMKLKDHNLKTAIKWLPYCSVSFISENIIKYVDDISLPLLLRLSEISLDFLHIYCKTKRNSNYMGINIYDVLSRGMKYANQDIEKYLDILDSVELYNRPLFNSKITKLIMKKCPHRILNNLKQYIKLIHIKTFTKFIAQNEMKDFFVNSVLKENLHHVRNKIEHFIMRLPENERFEFVKTHFIDTKLELYPMNNRPGSSENIYIWYRYASFDVAFNDLKTLIQNESNPSDRHEMLLVILACTRNNLQDIHKLIDYYRTNHINEALKFKIHFVDSFIRVTKSYTFAKETWNILNDIFYSMDVYTESNHSLQFCIKCIMLYKIIHNETIPEDIVSKFCFNTLKKARNQLQSEYREKVFEYLYKFVNEKLEKHYENLTKNGREFEETLLWIKNTLDLLVDWKKDLSSYPDILYKIKELCKFTEGQVSNTMLARIYNRNKAWRKLLLNESILLNPSAMTCINVLKHDPGLINVYKTEIKSLCFNENISMKRFFHIVRLYKTDLAIDFKGLYYKSLEQKTGLKSTTFGLCVLLPPKELCLLIRKFIPSEGKINWHEIDQIKLSVQKNIAKNMHVARPQPPLNLLLLYAKGDYLKFVLPSLTSTLHNITSTDLLEEIGNLTITPVSLQKHIIRETYKKLQLVEILNILSSIWNTNKNSSIRATVFNLAFNLLCRETDLKYIDRIWVLVKTFIENLSTDENKIIYVTLSKADKVPIQIRPAFCENSYRLLKKLPERNNSESLIRQVITCTRDVMEYMDANFMTEVIIESFEGKIFDSYSDHYVTVISAFLLSSQCEKSQISRFETVLLPLLVNANDIWSFEIDNFHKAYISNVLNAIWNDIEDVVMKKNIPMPIKLFNLIHNKLQEILALEENYMLITSWKLAVRFITILDIVIKDNHGADGSSQSLNANTNKEFGNVYVAAVQKFSQVCLEDLNGDVQHYGSSIIIAFGHALYEVFKNFKICDPIIQYEFCKSVIDYSEDKNGYLIVLRILPKHSYEWNLDVLLELVKRIASHPDSEVKILCSTLRNFISFLI